MESVKWAGEVGAVMAMALSAAGSMLGVHVAGMATLGAWKKCYVENRPAPFLLISFVSAPLSQSIYGLIVMNALLGAAATHEPLARLGFGCLSGAVIGGSAWLQGRLGALAADAMSSTGKGFGQFLMVLGVIETVALFMMVFVVRILG